MPADPVDGQSRLESLKSKLKAYENAFKAQHGRIPEREEIKKDAAIGTFTSRPVATSRH
jgi:hypothetical protein